jgi:hypothetical protein
MTWTDSRAGYKQYKTNRKYMARMGNWRDNKDDEIKLDGIGGVNIMVKADVHRSGTCFRIPPAHTEEKKN